MPLWTCDFPSCNEPAVRQAGDCELCERHLCSLHLERPLHSCPNYEDAERWDPLAAQAGVKELARLFDRINIAALEARASHLRDGIQCHASPLTCDGGLNNSLMGGMNYHIPVIFKDGVVWIARVRRSNATSPPTAVRDFVFESEYATLKFLEKTQVPTPRVYDFALDQQPGNEVGVGYILMEMMPGKCMEWDNATKSQQEKIMEKIADIFVELRNYPFECIGSLREVPEDGCNIGPIACEYVTDFDSAAEIVPLGPFHSSRDHETTAARFVLDRIVQREICTAERAVDCYLAHRYLLDLIQRITPQNDGPQKFYLKHADSKSDNFLVDDDFNITAIIDWEWAVTAAPEEAFNTPNFLIPASHFFDGNITPGPKEIRFAEILEEKGHQDIAQYVHRGRLFHLLSFCSDYNFARDEEGFLLLFKGLRDAAGVDAGLEWEDWKVVALERYKDDEGLKDLLAKYDHDSDTDAASQDTSTETNEDLGHGNEASFVSRAHMEDKRSKAATSELQKPPT